MNWNNIQVPKLAHGKHTDFGNELCFMEMTAFLAGEPHSDHPKCASPVLTNFGICLNDRSQAWRDALQPIVPLMIGTRNAALETERLRYLILNVVRRVVVPAIRPHAGDEKADALLEQQQQHQHQQQKQQQQQQYVASRQQSGDC